MMISLPEHVSFKPNLELVHSCASVMLAGKLFHNLGPHTLNALAAKVCLVTGGTTNLVEELPECNPSLLGLHFFIRSCRYFGAMPLVHLYTIVSTLCSILLCIGSQCRFCIHSPGLAYLSA